MWLGSVIGCAFLALCSAAPPAHINRLALFPDKSAWCEAKNITQIVGHTGCQSRSIENRSVQPEETHRPKPKGTPQLCFLRQFLIDGCIDCSALRQILCMFMLEHMAS